MTLPAKSSMEVFANDGFRPVLHVDFNRPERPIAARRGCWRMQPGQLVVLDDTEGTRCEGRYVRPASWGEDKYVYVEILPDTFEYYEPEPS